jgi:hypothetical protein
MRQQLRRKDPSWSLSLRRTQGAVAYCKTYEHNDTICILFPGIGDAIIFLFDFIEIHIPHLRVVLYFSLGCNWNRESAK